MTVIKERGWPGHHILCGRCIYHRNTLVSEGDKHIIVSTVGNLRPNPGGAIETIGHRRWYETLVFAGRLSGPYIEIDVSRQIAPPPNLEWGIWGDSVDDLPVNVDIIADEMHDSIVQWVLDDFAAIYADALCGSDNGKPESNSDT